MLAHSFFMSNNGCIRRKLDAQHALDFMVANGYQEVDDAEHAEVLFFFSCSADDVSEAVAREAVRELDGRRSPSAKIVIGGCLPGINRPFVRSVPDVFILGPASMNLLDDLVDPLVVPFHQVPEPNRISAAIFAEHGLSIGRHAAAVRIGDETMQSILAVPVRPSPAEQRYEAFKRGSAVLRVARGCLSTCAFCCIRSATGRLHSRPLDAVESTYRLLLGKGQRRFTLTGEDLGAYGLDIGEDVTTLLSMLASGPREVELALQALNPRWIVPLLGSLEELLALRPFVRHAIVPIQATSDRLLREMRREHTVADGERVFDALERAGTQVHTHLIIGFPGESPKEVDGMVQFMRCHPNIHYYVYPYNDRPGATSVRRDDKLPSGEIRQRFSVVMAARNELVALQTANQGA